MHCFQPPGLKQSVRASQRKLIQMGRRQEKKKTKEILLSSLNLEPLGKGKKYLT